MADSRTETPRKRARTPARVLNMAPPRAEKPAETSAQPPPEPAETPETPQETPPPGRPAVKPSTEPFPLPPKTRSKGGFCDAEEGMRYWRSLTEGELARCAVYINREHPKLNRLRELTAEQQELIRLRKAKEPIKYIDKPDRPFGEDTRMEFLNRYGSGTYKVYVNDTGVRKTKKGDPDQVEIPNRNVCKFLVSYWDSDFPPILDPSRPDQGLGILDLDHPENKSYIAELQMRGILPANSQQTGEDMANAEVVSKLVDKVDTLASQVADGKMDRALAELREEIRAKASTNGNDLTGKLLDIVLANNNAIRDMQRPQVDPSQQLFMNRIQSLEQELREERAERRRYEESLRTRAEQPPPDPFAFFERTVQTFQKAKDLFGGLNAVAGAANGGSAPRASRMTGTQEMVVDIVDKLKDVPILNALAQRLLNGTAPAANPATNGNGTAGAAAGAQQQHQPMTQDQLLKFVQDVVTPAMLQYLDDEATGAEFATWIYAAFPHKLKQLQQLGPDAIFMTYQQSGTWKFLQPRAETFKTFVRDFCNWKSDEEGTRGNQAPTSQATATTIDTTATPVPAEATDLTAMLDMPLEGESL